MGPGELVKPRDLAIGSALWHGRSVVHLPHCQCIPEDMTERAYGPIARVLTSALCSCKGTPNMGDWDWTWVLVFALVRGPLRNSAWG